MMVIPAAMQYPQQVPRNMYQNVQPQNNNQNIFHNSVNNLTVSDFALFYLNVFEFLWFKTKFCIVFINVS